MSNRAERRVKAIWLLADSLGAAWPEAACEPVRRAVIRLSRHVLQKHDRPMRLVIDRLRPFIRDILGCQESYADEAEEIVAVEVRQAYIHMLTALVNDRFFEVHCKSAAQKAAWLALNNALADLIMTIDKKNAGETGVERGCQWAAQVETILNSV